MDHSEPPADKEGGGQGEGEGDGGVQPITECLTAMSRKEKRKAMKKMKRKQTRKEIALKERQEEEKALQEEEARLKDPQELMKMREKEQEEADKSEEKRREFEERERAWIEAMEIQKKNRIEEEEEERRIKALEDEESRKQQIENANEDDDWEYVEEGPAEIIWQGNEIIVKKKRVKVPKRNKDQQTRKEDSDRPTSNPLPPQSEAFSDYKNASLSAQQLIETVAEQVPHFGTEQDKAHCPFHLKTGACRFGQRCSRVHFYPDKSSTLLIKNMYNGPGLAWELDEGLEYTDEEVERCYEEFYEDVHTEFLKFGEIINFKVCRNGAFHLRGNVYVQYSALESAVLAHQSINGRYFAGKQVCCIEILKGPKYPHCFKIFTLSGQLFGYFRKAAQCLWLEISCEFINVTRWKVAICGEYVKSRYKTCSRGTACNFIHCFRNAGGDYEWADSDRPPPKYWVEKMVALFGYSNAYEKQMMEDNSGQLRNSSKMSMMDSGRYGLRRSSSRERSYSSFTGSGRRYYNENYALKGTSHQRPTGDYKHRGKTLDGNHCEENTYLKDYNHRKSRKYYVESDGELLDTDVELDRDRYHGRTRKSSRQENRDHKNKTYETESHGHLLDRGRNRVTEHGSTRTSSSQQRKAGAQDDYGDCEEKVLEVDGDWSTRDKDRDSYHDSRRSSGHERKVGYADNHKDHKRRAHDSDGEWSDSNKKGDEHHSIRKSSGHSGNASNCFKQGESSTRSCTAELSEDSLDKDAEKDTSHARKRSKHWDRVSDKSNGDRAPAQGLRHSADCLSLQVKEVDSPVKKLRSDGTPEFSSLDQHDLRCISDVHIDKQDRWEPEPGSAEIYHSSKGKSGSSESNDSGRPGQYNERNESSEFDSKLYYDDEVGKADHYESGEVTCSKNRKSRQKSRKNDGDGDGDYRKRSRGSSQSGYWRYSNSSDVATDSSEDNKECRRHKKHHASHRSRDHKRHP